MLKTGKVVGYHNGICTIEFLRMEACKTCGQCKHADDYPTIELDGEYAVGDYVSIFLPDNQFLKATSIAYLLPLVALLLGMYLGSSIGTDNADTAALIGGALGISLSLFGIWIFEKKRKKRPSWEPYIKEKVNYFDTIPTEILGGCNVLKKEN